ncbi:MAG: Bor family protein [Saprospiraceae bacterium]
MKNKLGILVIVFAFSLCLSSCYTYTYMVGDGAQTGVEVKGHNQYFIYGLAQGKQSNAGEMAGGAENYQVTIQHTFIDGLLNALTFGLYTPTTTIVQK